MASVKSTKVGEAFVRWPQNALGIFSAGASFALGGKYSRWVVASTIAFACFGGFNNVVSFYERNLGYAPLDIRICQLRGCPKNEAGGDKAGTGTSSLHVDINRKMPPEAGAPSKSGHEGFSPKVPDKQGPVAVGPSAIKQIVFTPDPDRAGLRNIFRQLANADPLLDRRYPDLVANVSRIQRKPDVGPGVARCILFMSVSSPNRTWMTEEQVEGQAVSSNTDQAILANRACEDAVEVALERVKDRILASSSPPG